MARFMVKKPNGKYALFSTICDNYVLDDVTHEEMVEALVEEFREKTAEEVKNAVAILEDYETNYPRRFKMNLYPNYPVGSFEEAEETIRVRHSCENEDEEE